MFHSWPCTAPFDAEALSSLPCTFLQKSLPSHTGFFSFSSDIVWGWCLYTLSFKYPHRKKSGGLRSGLWGAHSIGVFKLHPKMKVTVKSSQLSSFPWVFFSIYPTQREFAGFESCMGTVWDQFSWPANMLLVSNPMIERSCAKNNWGSPKQIWRHPQ